jgi:integrase
LVVAAALKLAPMLPVRPGELRHAEWSEIDLEKGLWSIPASKTKIREPLLVPLPEQAIAILNQLKKITGSSKWCFPSVRDFKRPMSANTVNAGLRSLGYPKEVITGHGFRACFRTIADEVLHERPDLLEQQLGHSDLPHLVGPVQMLV